MHKLVERLKELSMLVPLEENFDWKFPTPPIEIPSYIEGEYSKNIYLKENFSIKFKNDVNLVNHYWIIQEWGGIKSFKKNSNNDKRIYDFKKQLPDGTLTKDFFETISSLSKLASFIDPNKYVIYDSRAVYSLNWLLFIYTDMDLYPQPQGRNSKLLQYDLPTIINLSKKGISYKPKRIAYHEYCKLLKKLSKDIFNDDKPYKMEMLLFTIATTEIIKCIEKRIKLMVRF